MRKTWRVARHEFLVTTGRLGYRAFVASVPVLAILGLAAAAIFQAVSADDEPSGEAPAAPPAGERVFGYVDGAAGADGQPLFSRFHQQANTRFAAYADEQAAMRDLFAGRIERLFIFPADYLATGRIVERRKERAGLLGSGDWGGEGALRGFVAQNLFEGQVGAELLDRASTPYRLEVVEVSESGAPADGGVELSDTLLFIAAGILVIASTFTASGYLLQSLTEEKENRIMEVLLSSIEPEHLMFGKLIGLGAAGLLQMAVWAAAVTGFALALGLIIDLPIEAVRLPSLGKAAAAFAYFVLGYALIGTLLAAIGAITTNQRQAGNITAFVVVPVVAPIWFTFTLVENPESTLARVLTFVPITAPVTSLMRLALGAMSGVEAAVSLAVLSLSVAAAVGLTARVFRAYLLVYGQQPGIGHLLRTLRGG